MTNKNKKKILFCDNTLWGLVNFRGDVIGHFRDTGHDVVLLAPEREDKQMMIQLPEGVRYIPVEMGRTKTNPLNDMKYFLRLVRIFRKERPDFVFNFTIKPNIYGSIAAKLARCHVTAMMAGLGYTFKHKTAGTAIARRLYGFGLTFADELFLLNADNKRTITGMGLCKEEKIILLDGGEGINLDKFRMRDNSSDSTTFIFIGRILWEKGYDEFARAAAIVKERHPQCQFRVLGALDPSYPKSVPPERIKADEEAGVLKYLGFTNDMNSIYSQKGIVITLPSYYGEGLNRSLMEACATGKPIITTDIAGCRETVEDGKNGYLVAIKDAEALAEAMEKYIALPQEAKRQLSLNSRKLAERKFDIHHVIAAYENIVNKG